VAVLVVNISYPQNGRGAWSALGGTLSLDGKSAGIYYRVAADPAKYIGKSTATAVAAGKTVSVNDYAVFRAVMAIQTEIGAGVDGVFGPETSKRLAAWQDSKGLVDDGIFGQTSAKAMFLPLLEAACKKVTNASPDLTRVARGHTMSESSWDPGAVGFTTPLDLGLCQINGQWHPDLSPEARLNPRIALPWQASFVESNIDAMNGNIRDGIAAYMLGIGGARTWVADGRPDVWRGVDVKSYIDGVLKNSTV
jgi:hypothetical protein